MTTHLCPVCSMPAPLGLVHCSLECEEQDPLPQPEETPAERVAYLKTQVEGIAATLRGPGVSNVERRMLYEDRKDMLAEIVRLEIPAPVEGASE